MNGEPNAYLDTLNRMEPDIHPVDPSAFYASAAISLKRIADSFQVLQDLEMQSAAAGRASTENLRRALLPLAQLARGYTSDIPDDFLVVSHGRHGYCLHDCAYPKKYSDEITLGEVRNAARLIQE